MSIQTTYLRPEDDPANWFTGTEVTGPAIVTSVIKGTWFLYDHIPSNGAATRPLLEFSEVNALHKFFVKDGHCLRRHGNQGLISGYRLPART